MLYHEMVFASKGGQKFCLFNILLEHPITYLFCISYKAVLLIQGMEKGNAQVMVAQNPYA